MKLDHKTKMALEQGLKSILASPKDEGSLLWIVRRPSQGQREVVQQGVLCENLGLIGDNWQSRGSSRTKDGSSHPDMQVTIMNSRVISLLVPSQDHWSLAGDQLYCDLDIGIDNLALGSQLAVGEAILEVTEQPHTGCAKFMARFGRAALEFVSTPEGKRLRLRGLNTRVVRGGRIQVGERVKVSKRS